MTDLPTMFGLEDVSAALGMSERWVRGKIKDDKPEITRFGHKIKFTREQYDAFVARYAKHPVGASVTTGRKRSAK